MQSAKRMRIGRRGVPRLAFGSVIMAMGIFASSAHADVIFVGGPTFNSTTNTGYKNESLPSPPRMTAGNGTAVSVARKYNGGLDLGDRAVRLDASGTAVELDNLGIDKFGRASSGAFAINTAGTAVGYAEKNIGGIYAGVYAVRWDASGTAANVLGNLDTTSSGIPDSEALAINTAGTAVGFALKYNGGTDLGTRAVLWNASGTAATELGNLGTDFFNVTNSYAYAINTAGTAVGYANAYFSGTLVGQRAVRWPFFTTAAIELDNLGTDINFNTYSEAYAINTAGTAVGYAEKYIGGTDLGWRAVRWNASGTAATELGNLGTDSSGFTISNAYAINTSGTTVGFAYKYFGGSYAGFRAVRWNASGTAATQLGNLDNGFAFGSQAYAINSAGTVVGFAHKFLDGTDLGSSAVAWGLDGLAVDLNTLLSPADQSVWKLTEADAISDTNWVTGIGAFDPDGTGPLASYNRLFLMQVPEPGSLSLLALGAIALLRRKRRFPSATHLNVS